MSDKVDGVLHLFGRLRADTVPFGISRPASAQPTYTSQPAPPRCRLCKFTTHLLCFLVCCMRAYQCYFVLGTNLYTIKRNVILFHGQTAVWPVFHCFPPFPSFPSCPSTCRSCARCHRTRNPSSSRCQQLHQILQPTKLSRMHTCTASFFYDTYDSMRSRLALPDHFNQIHISTIHTTAQIQQKLQNSTFIRHVSVNVRASITLPEADAMRMSLQSFLHDVTQWLVLDILHARVTGLSTGSGYIITRTVY